MPLRGIRGGKTMVKTLKGAITKAKRMAMADVYGISEHPFTAVEFRKTLPKEWQNEVEEAIVTVYHNT